MNASYNPTVGRVRRTLTLNHRVIETMNAVLTTKNTRQELKGLTPHTVASMALQEFVSAGAIYATSKLHINGILSSEDMLEEDSYGLIQRCLEHAPINKLNVITVTTEGKENTSVQVVVKSR